jgi:hypothetical protein
LILIGTDDYPFDVPLAKINGQWQFDTQQGKRELLARRVGSNELDAIALCAAYVDAQFAYASEKHDHVAVASMLKTSSARRVRRTACIGQPHRMPHPARLPKW